MFYITVFTERLKCLLRADTALLVSAERRIGSCQMIDIDKYRSGAYLGRKFLRAGDVGADDAAGQSVHGVVGHGQSFLIVVIGDNTLNRPEDFFPDLCHPIVAVHENGGLKEEAAIPRILYFLLSSDRNPELKAGMLSAVGVYVQQVKKLLQQGQRKGEISPDIDAAAAAMMFLGMLQPLAILGQINKEILDDCPPKLWQQYRRSIAL